MILLPRLGDDGVPAKHGWPLLRSLKGEELEVHYIEILRELGNQRGMLGESLIASTDALVARPSQAVDYAEGTRIIRITQ